MRAYKKQRERKGEREKKRERILDAHHTKNK